VCTILCLVGLHHAEDKKLPPANDFFEPPKKYIVIPAVDSHRPPATKACTIHLVRLPYFTSAEAAERGMSV